MMATYAGPNVGGWARDGLTGSRRRRVVARGQGQATPAVHGGGGPQRSMPEGAEAGAVRG